MEQNFLSENLDNINISLSRTSESQFIHLASLLMADSFNEKKESSDLLKILYKNISDVVNCVTENKISMMNLCRYSNEYESLHHGGVEDDAEYLIWAYMVLMRYLLEYSFKKYDSFYIERITYAIDDYHNIKDVFNNISKHGFRFFYLYVKNGYTPKLIQSYLNEVDSNMEELNLTGNKLDIAIRNSEDISRKYDELKGIDDEYFNEYKAKLASISEDLKLGIDARIKVVEDLDRKVNKANDSLTLEGLSQAYNDLSAMKNADKIKAYRVLKWSVACVFIPLIIKVLSLGFDVTYNLYGYILTGTATIILMYYFRIALLNYNSIKTELNQINLRITLCKFIRGYVEFSQRNDNHKSLSKFENLIFSNIIPDDKSIPATLDGIEQLAKLIDALKIK